MSHSGGAEETAAKEREKELLALLRNKNEEIKELRALLDIHKAKKQQNVQETDMRSLK